MTEIVAADAVLLRIRDGVGTITLNRPSRLNAFAGAMREQLRGAVETAAADRACRVIVITGAGRGFCSGADVKAMAELIRTGDDERFSELVEAGMQVVRAIRAAPQPVIAAVNGPAAGAGASLAIACDFRIASDTATLGFTFTRIGLHPDWGASFFLPRLVGPGRAAELILSGRVVGAEEAGRIGLFERVVPASGWDDAVTSLATELTQRPPLAVAAAKRTLEQALQTELEPMLAREHAAQLRSFRTADAREGITAFLEKRTPSFGG